MTTAMPIIAERHNLQRGDLCEIYVIGYRETYRHFGEYRFTAPDGKLSFSRGELGSPFQVKPDKIRSVRKITPAYAATQFSKGQFVRVRKYGSDYSATVQKIGRTRLTVSFMTRGGKDKTIAVPAWQVMA